MTKLLNFKKYQGLAAVAALVLISGCASTPAPGPIRAAGPMTSVTGTTGFATPRDMYHIVGPSETLWRIAKTYDVDINTLLAANKLDDPTKTKKGMKRVIPKTLGPRPVIPLYPATRWK